MVLDVLISLLWTYNKSLKGLSLKIYNNGVRGEEHIWKFVLSIYNLFIETI